MKLPRLSITLRILVFFASFLVSPTLFSQTSRIDSILKTYIVPKNITECFNYLNVIYEDSKEKENDIFKIWHLGIGLWIRNNWIYPNSSLWSYFKKFGYSEPDGISGLLERGFEEYLDGDIKDPEDWIAKRKMEINKVKLILDGKVSLLSSSSIKDPSKIIMINTILHPNAFQSDLLFPIPSVQFITTAGFKKSNRILINKNYDYKLLRKSRTIDKIIYLYNSDTIKYPDLVGNERKVLLIIDQISKPIVKVSIKPGQIQNKP
ncbi:MAG TPA: DUF6794 domain-containing protein [Ruminiclostridium sp.]|nr:DUF6794 domain-containing protein [Ruminiclostridium sp.]